MNAITQVLASAKRSAAKLEQSPEACKKSSQEHELAEMKAMTAELNGFLDLPTTDYEVRKYLTQVALQSSRAIMKLLGQENGDLRNLILFGEILGHSKPEYRAKMQSLSKKDEESIRRAIGAIQGLVYEVDPYEFRNV